MLQILIVSSLFFFISSDQISNSSQRQNLNFPKKLWISWNSDPSNAPIFTRLCINNMRHFTQISGWQLILFDSNSVFKYLSVQTGLKLKFLRSKLTNPSPQTLADLHRIFVVYQNGGMWLDANSFFVRELSWVQNLNTDSSVYNKVVDDPEIIMFTYNWLFGANRTILFDDQHKVKVRLFPGAENWSFLAKKKAKLLGDHIERTIYAYEKQTLNEYFEQNNKLGYVYRQEIDPYFLLSNYQFQTLFQHKQKEIETNPSKFGEKNVIEYYKMWNIDALQTAYLLYEVNQWEVQSSMRTLLYKKLEDFTERFGKKVNFIKFSASYYPFVNAILNKSLSLICLNAIQPFPSTSLISEFLFKYSPNEKLVQRYLQLQKNAANNELIQCKDMVEQITSSLFDIGAAVVAALIVFSLAIYCWIKSLHCCIGWAKHCAGGQGQRAYFNKLSENEPLQFNSKLEQK